MHGSHMSSQHKVSRPVWHIFFIAITHVVGSTCSHGNPDVTSPLSHKTACDYVTTWSRDSSKWSCGSNNNSSSLISGDILTLMLAVGPTK